MMRRQHSFFIQNLFTCKTVLSKKVKSLALTPIFSVDTRHRRFEMLDNDGKHIDEVDFNLKPQGKTDKTGGHNLNVK